MKVKNHKITLKEKEMAEGNTVNVVTSDSEVSTEQAAAILNVSVHL